MEGLRSEASPANVKPECPQSEAMQIAVLFLRGNAGIVALAFELAVAGRGSESIPVADATETRVDDIVE